MFKKESLHDEYKEAVTIVDTPSGITGTSDTETSNEGEEIVRWYSWESNHGWAIPFNSTTTDGYTLDYFCLRRTDYSYDEGNSWDIGSYYSYIYPVSGQRANGTLYFHTKQGSTTRSYTMTNSGSTCFRYSGYIPFGSITQFVITNEPNSPL